jgi:hypothetical protein
LKDLVHEKKEKHEKIKSLEEEVRHSKGDSEIIKEFRLCVQGFMIEFQKMEMKMYVNMQVFQQLSAWIMAQHSRSQDKNTHFTTIREGMNEMQGWITRDPIA